MRILVVTNFYPPARAGGYTQWCQEVADSLCERGHQVYVLTSNYQVDKINTEESDVFRTLRLDGDLFHYDPLNGILQYPARLMHNKREFAQAVELVQPDVVFIWGMWALSRSVAYCAEQLLPEFVVYFISDYWPSSTDMHRQYWTTPTHRWWLRVPKKLLGGLFLAITSNSREPALHFQHAICVSHAVRRILINAGLPFYDAVVIHGGTDLNRLEGLSDPGVSSIARGDFQHQPLRILYAGQLVPHKGVHTVVEAIDELVNHRDCRELRLTIAGSGHPDYELSLRQQVDSYHLENYVEFRGPVPKEAMFKLMREHEVLIFPSLYEEPFARMTQEAMLARLLIIGTTTGGTSEVLFDGQNGLTYTAGNALELADKIALVMEDPNLIEQLGKEAEKTVQENYTLDKMVDRIEAYLQKVVRKDSG